MIVVVVVVVGNGERGEVSFRPHPPGCIRVNQVIKTCYFALFINSFTKANLESNLESKS